MIVDRFEPVNLSELIPELRLEMEPSLQALDRLLDDDEIFLRIKADLSKRHPNSESLGRRSTPVEVILRMLMVRRLYDWSSEATERNVSDSLLLRQFTRLYLEAAPDDSILIRWAKLIGADTLECLNERAVTLALERKVTRGWEARDRCHGGRDQHLPPDPQRLAQRWGKSAGPADGQGQAHPGRSTNHCAAPIGAKSRREAA
jgi:transposase, IS5 family